MLPVLGLRESGAWTQEKNHDLKPWDKPGPLEAS